MGNLPPLAGATADGGQDPALIGPSGGREELAQRVTDYLAGMTDRYCIRVFSQLEVPQAFAR